MHGCPKLRLRQRGMPSSAQREAESTCWPTSFAGVLRPGQRGPRPPFALLVTVQLILSPRMCAATVLRAPQASPVCRVSKGTKASRESQGETAQKEKR